MTPYQPKPAELFHSSYKQQDLIEKGASGSVFHCTRLVDGQQFAVKVVDINRENPILLDGLNQKEMVLKEIEILKKLSGHRNIVELIDAFEMDTCFYLVFEMCAYGDLQEFMWKNPVLPQEVAFRIMKQVLSALHHCHQMGIVHRDVNPNNILIDEDLNVKLIDFGFASQLGQGQHLTDCCGTYGFYAPEMLLKSCYPDDCQGYRLEIDAYACGIILYTMLSGFEPFDTSDEDEYSDQVMNGEYFPLEGPGWDAVSEDAKLLVSQLIEYEPQHRMSMASAISFMEA